MTKSSIAFTTFLLAATAAVPCMAQRSVRPGTIELSARGGGTFDLPGAAAYAGLFDSTSGVNNTQRFLPGRKSQPHAGGGLAVSLAKVLWIYGNYSYIFPDRTSASVTLDNSTGITTTSRHYWSADGGLQLAFPTIQRVSPYLEAGFGYLHQNYNTVSYYTNVLVADKAGNSYRRRGVVNNIPTPHVGAGVRIFVKERSGFLFSMDGYYGFKSLEQQVPGDSPTFFPIVTRKGWGKLSAGYFIRLGRR